MFLPWLFQYSPVSEEQGNADNLLLDYTSGFIHGILYLKCYVIVICKLSFAQSSFFPETVVIIIIKDIQKDFKHFSKLFVNILLCHHSSSFISCYIASVKILLCPLHLVKFPPSLHPQKKQDTLPYTAGKKPRHTGNRTTYPDLMLSRLLWGIFSPFNIVVVAQVMSLLLLLCVVQNHHRGIEVDNLSRRQQVQVGAAVTSTVAIPVQCFY